MLPWVLRSKKLPWWLPAQTDVGSRRLSESRRQLDCAEGSGKSFSGLLASWRPWAAR